MTWRYMPARETHDGEEMWSIREVYEGKSWTAEDIAPAGDSHEELREVLRMMLHDVERSAFLDLDGGFVAQRVGGLRGPR